MIYSLFLYKYQVQNTAAAAPRHVYDTRILSDAQNNTDGEIQFLLSLTIHQQIAR